MDKTLNLAKTSTRGGFNMFWGVAISSIVSAIGIMIVAGILTESEYGLYVITLTVPTLIQLIRDLGVDQSIIRYTAQYNQEDTPNKIKHILIVGLTFEIILGTTLSLLSFFLSYFVASSIFNRPEITFMIQIASFTILGQAFIKLAESSFIGYEKLHYHSVTLIINSLIKTILMIILVLSGFGVLGATLGHTIAFIITGIIGTIIFYFKIYKEIKNKNQNKLQFFQTLKKMLKYGLPLSGATILTGIITQFYNFLIAVYLADSIIGNYQVAMNFAILVAFFVQPIQTIMFPAFSKINGKKEPQTIRKVFNFSVKYSSLLIVPATFMVIALSQTAVSVLFGDKYQFSPIYLSLYSILFLFTAFGYLNASNLIKSQGRTDLNLKLTLISALSGIILALVLIPNYGIIGLISTILISTVPNIILALWWINKNYKAKINIKSSTKIIISSATSAIITYITINQLNTYSWVNLIIGAIIYFVAYILTAPIIGAIDKNDIKNLREMLRVLGPIQPILNVPLSIIDKILIKMNKN